MLVTFLGARCLHSFALLSAAVFNCVYVTTLCNRLD